MTGYNIYFEGNLLNNSPLTLEDINKMKEYKKIYKRIHEGNNKIIKEIPVNNLKIVKCIMV
jgi:hypothetical protein